MTQYVIHNNQQGALTLVDSGRLSHTVNAGSSGTFDLSPAWFNELVSVVGASNVVPVPVNSYRYAGLALAPVATPTDVILIEGSGSAVVRVKRIKITGAATAQGAMPVQIIRRSSLYTTIGSAALTSVTAGKEDNNSVAATGVVSTVGTGNFTTVGTTVATIDVGRLGMPALGTGTAGDGQRVLFDFDEDANELLTLRTSTDVIAINFAGSALPSGGVIDFLIETVESAT